MAIKKQINFAGDDFKDAYHRIKYFTLSRNKDNTHRLNYGVEVYISPEKRLEGDDPLIDDKKYYDLLLSEEEYSYVMEILYNSLKSTKYFDGSIDA